MTLVLSALLAGCYTATLVRLAPTPSEELKVDGGQGRLSDSDVETAKQIAKEIAAHFGFEPYTVEWMEFEKESVFSTYSYAGVGPVAFSIHLSDDRSHMDVAINDLSNSVEGGEIVRLIQADFRRMFEEAYPDYEVTLE